MPIRPPNHLVNPLARGSAVAWTVGLLALTALTQLLLFIAIQGRAPATTKTGTVQESTSQPTQAAQHQPAPATTVTPTAAAINLPDSLPPIDDTPPGRHRLVANPVPVPTTHPPVVAPENPTVDPAALPRDDVRVLVAEAIRLRRNGDMAGAVGKLNTALDILPGHPRVIFEMAATYEAMGMTERAIDNYRNVADLGPSRAGALYAIAENRVKSGITPAGRQAGADDLLYLGDVEEILRPESDGATTVVLRFQVIGALGCHIDPAAVLLPVRFFNTVNSGGAEIATTDQPVVQWTSMPIDWKDPGIESVEITCRLLAPDDTDGSQQKYLGYKVELYYQDALLDVVARPRRLARFNETPAPAPDLPDALPDSLGGPLLQ